ncbi:13420_t:CDS:2, partial [Racocetra persica]
PVCNLFEWYLNVDKDEVMRKKANKYEKSEDLSKQNYKANDSKNCYENEINNSRFAMDYVKGFIKLNSLSCQHEDAKAEMLSTLKLYSDKDLEK